MSRSSLPKLMRIHALLICMAFSFLYSIPEAIAEDFRLVLSHGPEASDPPLEFSLEQLDALPQTTIHTANEFVDGVAAFRGPLVLDILAHIGLEDAETLRFIAANDYYVDIPTQDFRQYNAVLAIELNGTRLSRRDKGPLWLMYPLSDHPELQGDPIYITRLIWQVVRIEAL